MKKEEGMGNGKYVLATYFSASPSVKSTNRGTYAAYLEFAGRYYLRQWLL